jgi:cytochrome c553
MSMIRAAGFSLAWFLLAAPTAWAQAAAGASTAAKPPEARLAEVDRDPKLFEHYYKVGQKVAAFCANCHGAGGNSVKPEVPNLAGQNTSYLLEQVRQFSDGRRKNLFMEGLMKALNPEEKIGIAVYFSSQTVAPQPARDATLVAKGKAYYDKVCFRCHGESGHGSAAYARIAGQQGEYLATTLKRYRDGSAARADAIMAANTKRMTDDDINAVVAYVMSMK